MSLSSNLKGVENKMDSKNLTAELTTLETRRTALAGDVDSAQHALDDARDGLISGKVKVNTVVSSQSKYSALTEACAALDARITEKHAELVAAQAAEAESARQQRIATLDTERKALAAEHDARLHQLDKNITEVVEGVMNDMHRYGKIINELAGLGVSYNALLDRDWSHMGLANTQHIAMMVREAVSWEQRRFDKANRIAHQQARQRAAAAVGSTLSFPQAR